MPPPGVLAISRGLLCRRLIGAGAIARSATAVLARGREALLALLAVEAALRRLFADGAPFLTAVRVEVASGARTCGAPVRGVAHEDFCLAPQWALRGDALAAELVGWIGFVDTPERLERVGALPVAGEATQQHQVTIGFGPRQAPLAVV